MALKLPEPVIEVRRPDSSRRQLEGQSDRALASAELRLYDLSCKLQKDLDFLALQFPLGGGGTSPTGTIAGVMAPVVNVKDYAAKGDGKTDDTAAVQRALNRADEWGVAIVYFPIGEYVLDLVFIHDNTDICGAGWGMSRIIWKEESESAYLFTNVDHTNGNSNIRIHDIQLDGNKAKQSKAAECLVNIICLDTGSNENIVFERIWAHHSNGLGLITVNTRTFVYAGNLVTDTDRDGTTVYENCSRGVVAYNTYERCNDDSIGLNAENGESEEHLMEDILVTGNVIRGQAPTVGSYGGITGRAIRSCAIVGNVLDRCKQFGILLADYNTTPVADVLIANNTIAHNGENGNEATGRQAIMVFAGIQGTAGVNDVTVIGNHIRYPASWGIYAENDFHAINGVQHLNVVGNFIHHGGADGIKLHDSTMTNIHISDNVSHDNVGYGIFANTFTAQLQLVFCDDNTTYNNGADGILLGGIVSGTCRDNDSYNDAAGEQERGITLERLRGDWRRDGNFCPNNEAEDIRYVECTCVFHGPGEGEEVLSGKLETAAEYKDIPGLEIEVNDTGVYEVTANLDILCLEAAFASQAQLLLNGGAVIGTIIYGAGEKHRSTQSRTWRVPASAGDKLKLQARKTGSKYNVEANSSLIVTQVV